MDHLKQSVVESLDGAANIAIYPYLPYILQDLWELGTDPQAVVELVKQHISLRPFSAVDLGCGKGAVSIKLAETFDCKVTGIDALPEFIDDARKVAAVLKVDHKCSFEVADARERIASLSDFDIAIIGAVGQLFGDTRQTLEKVGATLKSGGHIILDDGWLPDESNSGYSRCQHKSAFYQQISQAGFDIVSEINFEQDFINNANNEMMEAMKQRIDELIKSEPHNRELFLQYLRVQQFETDMMATEMVCALWLLKKIND